MTLVSIYSSNGKLRCELSGGGSIMEGEAKTFLGALMKTYLKLMIRRTKEQLFKWREIWTEH